MSFEPVWRHRLLTGILAPEADLLTSKKPIEHKSRILGDQNVQLLSRERKLLSDQPFQLNLVDASDAHQLVLISEQIRAWQEQMVVDLGPSVLRFENIVNTPVVRPPTYGLAA